MLVEIVALSEKSEKLLDRLGKMGWQLGLDRMQSLAAKLNNPERDFACVHIAGSNGKGSVACMLESIYSAAGYRVGLYTSPHLVSPTERIRVNGAPITGADFESLLWELAPLFIERKATYFEAITLMAFVHFSRAGVELAILETGLGGRFDATNIVTPCASVITTISYEHADVLGESLEEIAFEKAGIVKRGVPCILGHVPDAAAKVILRRCLELNAPVIHSADTVRVSHVRVHPDRTVFDLRCACCNLSNVELGLTGAHQAINAGIALATVCALSDALPVATHALQSGLKRAWWPARFQIYSEQPTFVLDVAHNPESMQRLVETLQQAFPGRRPVVVFGLLADKDVRATLQPWRDLAAHFVVVTAASERAVPAAGLMPAAASLQVSAVCAGNMAQALRFASEEAGPTGLVIVTGSHYVVGEFMREQAQPQ